MNDIQSVIHRVYEVAETLYLAKGHVIPEGCSFSRSLGEDAEFVYQAASAAMMMVLTGD